MKNERYIQSVNRIEPGEMAQERMLGRILEAAHSNQPKIRKVNYTTKTLNRKRLAPIAACFVLVVALVGVFGNNAGWFGSKTYTADTGGAKISFHKASQPGIAELYFDFNVTSRDLTVDEIRTVFGDMSATAYATFNAENHSFVRLEGKIGDTKVIVAAPGAPVADTVIEGNESVSDVEGVPVTAGYFITKANSQGNKTIIYFASFTLGNATMYVELGGDESNSDAFRDEIASVIKQLIENGAPNLSVVTE
jgi:hypothetical protein